MKLIRLHEHLGPSPTARTVIVIERDICIATDRPLAEALQRLAAYQTAYNLRHPDTNVCFTLLGVDEIHNVPTDVLLALRCESLEDLERDREPRWRRQS